MTDQAMNSPSTCNWPDRWTHVQKILERGGPLAHPEFEPSPDSMELLQENINILVVGAGGLGCELLKDLALIGFRNIDVIDMDTIDLSNLNRQFLFRKDDIGKPKAEVAAAFINKRIPGCKVTPHYGKIQDFDACYYRKFHIVMCGLDSIIARRWLNGMLLSLLAYDEDGNLDPSTIVPMIDGGTEGFKGNARVIYPGMSACVECTLDLYPPQVNFPMCTIAHTPRLPEHCIEYCKVLQWPQEHPFGENVSIDGDDPTHIKWLYEKSVERAEKYGITGVTYRLTQGVVKRIIPAVASTNAVIAAACATECFKVATSASITLNNYVNFTDTEGVYTYTFEAERKENCPACSQVPQLLSFSEDAKLQEVLDYLQDNHAFQLKSPGLTTVIDGKHHTLYISTVASIERQTKHKLKMSLKELGLQDGQEINVADPTTPNTLICKLQLASSMEKD